MGSNLKISVVIPAYNSEAFIERSINSVLRQTYTPEQIIVVDDGSKDQTFKVIEKFGEKVCYKYKDNGGEASARNFGIAYSECNWIAFLDSDDEWISTHLENFVQTISQKPDLMWYGAPIRHINEKNSRVIFTYRKKKNKNFISNLYFSDYLLALPPVGFFSSSTMVINSNVFKKAGLFDISKKTGTDRDMWFRIGLLYPEIGYCGIIGANIYKRGDSLSHSNRWDPDKDIQGFLDNEKLAERLGENNLIRAQPRIIYRVKGLLRKAIYRNDISTVRKIASIYFDKLPLIYKLGLMLIIRFPLLTQILRRLY